MSQKFNLRRQDLELRVDENKSFLLTGCLAFCASLHLASPTAELTCKPRRSTLCLRGPSKSGTCQARALLSCLPCLALSLLCVPRVLSCLSVQHPLFCLGAAGCGPFTTALSAFARPGLKGDTRRGWKAFQAGAQATGAVVRRCPESDAGKHSPRSKFEGRRHSPRLENVAGRCTDYRRHG